MISRKRNNLSTFIFIPKNCVNIYKYKIRTYINLLALFIRPDYNEIIPLFQKLILAEIIMIYEVKSDFNEDGMSWLGWDINPLSPANQSSVYHYGNKLPIICK